MARFGVVSGHWVGLRVGFGVGIVGCSGFGFSWGNFWVIFNSSFSVSGSLGNA